MGDKGLPISAATAGRSAADDKSAATVGKVDGDCSQSPEFTDNHQDYEHDAVVVVKSQESQQTHEVVTIISVDKKIELKSAAATAAATADATQRVSQTISTERDKGLEPLQGIFHRLRPIHCWII